MFPQHQIHNIKYSTSQQQKYFYLFSLAILLVYAYFQASFYSVPIFPLDDAYIVLHNVQVFQQGFDPNYPGVSPLIGTTSAIHLFVVALLAYVISLPWAAEIVQWIAITLYSLGVIRLAFLYEASIFQTSGLLLLALFSGNLISQLLNGLETGMALAAIVWSLVLAAQPITTRRRICAAVLWGILPFLRPELILLSGLLFLRQIFQYIETGFIGKIVNKLVIQDFFIAFSAALPWLIWYYSSTGLPFPNTISAKLIFFSELHLPFAIKLKAAFVGLMQFLLLLGLPLTFFIFLLCSSSLGRLGLVFIILFLTLVACVSPYELDDNLWRYLTILFPFIFFGCILALRNSQLEIRIIANIFLVLAVLQTVSMLPVRWQYYRYCLNYTVNQLAGVAQWCDAHLPGNSVLLIHDTGYIAYATRFHLVDMVGLKSPDVVAYYKKYSLLNNGANRGEAIAKIVEQKKPGYFVLLPRWDTMFNLTSNLQAYGYQFKTLYAQADGYKVEQIEVVNNSV